MLSITVYNRYGKPEWGFNLPKKQVVRLYYEAMGTMLSW